MRWGLIGTGPWARQIHAPALQACKDVDFIGVWGRDAARTADVAAQYRATAFPTLAALLDNVEAVSFAVTPAAQAALAERALASGAHVLLEKPVATDPSSALLLSGLQQPRQCALVFLTRLSDPERLAQLSDRRRLHTS
jgi:predicted dehydrogenase